MENIKRYKTSIFVFMGIFLAINIIQIKPYLFLENINNISEYHVMKTCMYGIKVDTSKSRFVVDGWVFSTNEKISTFDVKVGLLSADGKLFCVKTNMVRRDDVEDTYKGIYGDKYGLKYSGYLASAYKFFIPKGIYKVVLLYRNNGEKYLICTEREIEI